MSTPPSLPLTDIDIVAGHLRGKRRATFMASMEVVRESLAQGAWVKRGLVRMNSGLLKGIGSRAEPTFGIYQRSIDRQSRESALNSCYMAAKYGSLLHQSDLDAATDADLAEMVPKVPVEVTRAWLRLMIALRPIVEDLDASRPLPVYTPIGLSPRVTKTLQDARLDLDLSTRILCPLVWRWDDARDRDGQPIVRSDGTRRRVKVYFTRWPEGTVFGTSRFCDSGGCEACGKSIPSGWFVPVVVADHAGTPHGFWFGRDCASNILGLRDAGLKRPGSES